MTAFEQKSTIERKDVLMPDGRKQYFYTFTREFQDPQAAWNRSAELEPPAAPGGTDSASDAPSGESGSAVGSENHV